MTSKIDPFVHAGAKSRGARPWFLEDKDVERVLNITLALAQEVSVLRERMDTIERLAESGQPITKAAIENFEPTKEEATERALVTQEFITRLFRILQQDREAIAVGQERTSEEIAAELTT